MQSIDNFLVPDSDRFEQHSHSGGHGHVGGHHRAVPDAHSHHRTLDASQGGSDEVKAVHFYVNLYAKS